LFNLQAYSPTNGDGVVAGPSTFFFLDTMKVMVCALQAQNSAYIQDMTSAAGDYVRYIHGGLGLAYEVWNGEYYMETRDPLTGEIQTRFDSANPGQYLLTPATKGENIGIRVAGLTNDTALARVRGDIYLPGAGAPGSIFPFPWVNSPLPLSLNDQITHFHTLPLGDQNSWAVAPLLHLSRRKAGDILTLKARTVASGYQQEVVLNVVLVQLPPFYDYPLAKYHEFPWFQVSLYGTFFAQPFPQDPGVVGSNGIDPALPVPTITVI